MYTAPRLTGQEWYPATTQLPLIHTVADLLRNVNTILEAHAVSDIITSLSDGFKTMLEVDILDEDPTESEITIALPHIEDTQTPCMMLRFEYARPHICSIDLIQHSDCIVPETRTGTWLVQLADNIARSLGAQRAVLDDGAYIRVVTADNTELDIDLAILRLFEGRDTWYSSFGFNMVSKLNGYTLCAI